MKYFGPFTDPAITIKTLTRRLIADEIFAPASAANRAAAGRRLVRTDQTEAALRYIITAKRVDDATRTLATRLIESGEAAAAVIWPANSAVCSKISSRHLPPPVPSNA